MKLLMDSSETSVALFLSRQILFWRSTALVVSSFLRVASILCTYVWLVAGGMQADAGRVFAIACALDEL